MKVKVTIQPIVQIGNEVLLPCAYLLNGVWKILTDYGTVENHTGDLKTSTHKKRTNITFTKKTSSIISYEYENDPELQTQTDKNTQKVVEVFFGQHPLLTYNGKHHSRTKTPIFNMENLNERTVSQVSSFKDKLAIQNKIAEMSLEELQNVADYYGHSPTGKTDTELMVLLGDPATGVCTNGENAVSFKKTWMDVNEETIMRVVLKRAIRLGIITEKREGNRTDYFLKQTFLGTNFNDVLAYAQRETNIYKNHIEREVSLSGEGSAEKVASKTIEKTAKKVEESGEMVKTWTTAELENMRQELYKLQSEGYVNKSTPTHNLKGHTLEARIAEGNAKKKEAELKLQEA